MAYADDAFFSLMAHKVAPFQFDVGLGAVNASIRDQIVRAQMIVRAIKHLDDGKKVRPLLIFGAGIAGLAAAEEAERLKLGFVLVEKRDFPSGALAGTGERYLSPTMYEWPAPLFDDHRHPPEDKVFLGADKDTGFPLDFTGPVTISKLRTTLTTAFSRKLLRWETRAAASRSGNWYLPRTRIAIASKEQLQALMTPQANGSPHDLPQIHLVQASAGGTNRVVHPNWIIFAGGFSAEKTMYAGIDFNTPAFWYLDKLTEPSFGFKPGGAVSALIAGSGDGAIQDALRCLVNAGTPEPVAIWKAVIAGADLSGKKTKRGVDAILREIMSLDQYTSTAFMWSGKKEVYRTVDAANKKLVAEFLRLSPLISTNVLTMMRVDVERVHIQRNRAYFTRCYALNRFLIHLIKRVLDQAHKAAGTMHYPLPMLTFGRGDILPGGIVPGAVPRTYVWQKHTFHRVVVRIGAAHKSYQTIGLTGIDPSRLEFGRIPPPFVPAKGVR